MNSRNKLALATIALSFVVLVPGLIQPLITISASVGFGGQVFEIFSETRSILQTIRSLNESGNRFVAGLILLFSVIVPFAKGLILVAILVLHDRTQQSKLFYFVRNISKWSMADVFVVGVYVAFLSAKASENLDATLGIGFYLFALYCLISLAALQIMKLDAPREKATAAKILASDA